MLTAAGLFSDSASLSPEDAEQLVDLRIARPQRPAIHHLRKDGADAPHVDGRRVRALTKQDFRGAVPQSDNLQAVKRISNKTHTDYRRRLGARGWKKHTSALC